MIAPLLLAVVSHGFVAPVTPPRPAIDLPPFDAYLARPEPKNSFKVTASTTTRDEIELTSQTWQGIDWKHQILLQKTANPVAKGVGVLFITGDGPRPGDYRDLALVAGATQLPVAILFNIPNQPIYGMKEDDLIAHTFEQYLATGDATWPLLFPMAKSAIKAMDAVVAATRGTDNPITQFVVTGASKRGWTTWLVGASRDPRVIGIAPMVIDTLDMPTQMKHQIDTWGDYSVQIQDYTRRGLQKNLADSGPKSLSSLVDPFVYRNRIRIPVLMVNGANDPYWVTDATSQYWNRLGMPKSLVSVPNAGHDLGNKVTAVETIGAFAKARAVNRPFPRLDVAWDFSDKAHTKGVIKVRARDGVPASVNVWTVSADNKDFRPEKWEKSEGPTAGERFEFRVDGSSMKNRAIFLEARYSTGIGGFSLTTPPLIFSKS